MNIKPNELLTYTQAGFVPAVRMRGSAAPGGDLSAMANAIWRRRRLAFAILTICLAGALAYVMFATPQFTATATVLIDTKMNPAAPAQGSNETLVDPAVVDTQVELLRTGKIALDVVDRLGLARDQDFVDQRPSLLGALLSSLSAKPESTEPADPRYVAAANFAKRVKVQRLARSYLVEVSATTRDATRSAAIANAVADAYIQDQLGSALENSQRSSDWMHQRLQDVRQRTEAADAALRAFRETRAAGSAAMTLDRAELARLRAALAAYAEARGALGRGALGNGVTPQAGTLLDNLDDGETRRLLAAARGAVAGDGPAARDALLGRLDQLEEDRRRELGAAQLRADMRQKTGDEPAGPSGSEAAREESLDRAAQEARNTFAALQNRTSRVSAFLQQQAIPITEARVLTAATPPLGQSAPKTAVVLLLALVGGAATGLAAAFLRETLDRRARWPEQVTHGLGQVLLGPLPRARRGWRSRERDATGGLPVPLLIAGRGMSSAALETLRSTKVMLDHTTDRGRGRVVGIVSAFDREGRATMAVNLAALMADTGARVLLLDADLHDGGFSRAAAPGAAGLATVLTERRPLAASVVGLPLLGFDILPGVVDAAPAHPTELLASGAMRELLAEARQTYDYVVMRVPPLLCTVDIRAIEDAVDAFVLTVASGETRLDDLENALASCPALSRRLLGVVLNRSMLAPRRRAGGARAARRTLGATA